MKKKRIELSQKLNLNKETITGLNPAQQQGVEGGKDVAASALKCEVSGSGCDCQRVTCGIIACTVVACVTQPPNCDVA